MGNVIVENITRTPVENGSNWGSVAGVTPPPSGDVVYPLTYADRTKTVTADATGSGDGSIGSPWTLAQSMTTAVAGDVVGIEAGVYVGVQTAPSDSGEGKAVFRPTNSGTDGNPIVFIAENLAYNNTTGYSDLRNGETASGISTQPLVGGNGESYIHWVGLYSNGALSNNKQKENAGMVTHWNAVGCVVANCKLIGDVNGGFSDNNVSGIRFENTSDNAVYGNYFEGFSLATSGSGANMSGIISYKAALLDIHHNTFYNCGNAWQPKGSFGTYDNEGCKFYNNLGDNCSQMVRSFTLNQLPNLIHNNIHNNALACFYSVNSTDNGAVRQSDNKIFNNTLIAKDPNASSGVVSLNFMTYDWQNARAGVADTINNAMFNNILYEPRGYLTSSGITGNDITTHSNFADYDYNCVYGAAYGVGIPDAADLTFAEWQAQSGMDANSTTTDPLFVSATDFHLQAGSPALTGGNDIYNFYGGGAGSTIPQGAYVTGTEQIGNGVTV